jgi:hypothetical protein
LRQWVAQTAPLVRQSASARLRALSSRLCPHSRRLDLPIPALRLRNLALRALNLELGLRSLALSQVSLGMRLRSPLLRPSSLKLEARTLLLEAQGRR